MSEVLRILFYFIVEVFVPVMLGATMWYLYSVSKRLDDSHHQKTTRAGFLAGGMLFMIIFIYQVSVFLRIGFPDRDIFQGFDLGLALIGGLSGFIVFSGGRRIIPPVLSGWLILLGTFVSFYAFFHYVFVRTYNELLLSLVLGGVFGMLAYFASSPASLREFLRFK